MLRVVSVSAAGWRCAGPAAVINNVCSASVGPLLAARQFSLSNYGGDD